MKKTEYAEEKLQKMKKYVPEAEKSAGGNSNRITRDYLDSLLIEYRHIEAKIPSIEMELFGRYFATPIMLGGMAAMVPKLHEGGMAELAMGCKLVNGVFWSGYISDLEFEEVTKTGVSAIRIIKPLRDEDAVLAAIKHDEASGAFAVAMDIDHGFNAYGEYFPEVEHAYGALGPKTEEDLKRYVQASSLPFFAKGVLSVADALACARAGAAGIVLSHHKGEYDYAVPPLLVLPRIREAVGSSVKIFVDCGISSGMDAFKALALGADGVCAARSFLRPFALDGADGVARKLAQMSLELKGVMAKTCIQDLKHMDSSVIYSD